MIKGTTSDFHLNCLNLTLIFPLFISHFLLSKFVATVVFLWFSPYLHPLLFHSHFLLCSDSCLLSFFFSFKCLLSHSLLFFPFVDCVGAKGPTVRVISARVCVCIGVCFEVLLVLLWGISFEHQNPKSLFSSQSFLCSLSLSLSGSLSIMWLLLY